MGKPTKQHRKRKFNYDKNRKKQWMKSKKMPTIECKQIRNAWDSNRSVKENMKEMGLATDPNKTLKVPKTKDTLVTSIPGSSKKREKKEDSVPTKQYVALELEAEANIPQRRRLRLSEPETRYCIYMMERYGEDYKAMARDMKNYYQDTPKQIKAKIKAFKSIPEQYGEYLKSKGVTERPQEGVTTPKRRTIEMGVAQRHDTRKRRAKRRNGHFTTPPGQVPTPAKRSGKSEDIPWHKVKRKLQFGRVPPRPRSNSSSQPARSSRLQKAKRNVSPKNSATNSVAHKPGLSRELHHLLNMTSACFVPVRLRSTFKSWGHCHGDRPKQHGCKLHSSHELTNVKITDNCQHPECQQLVLHKQNSTLRSLRISRRSQYSGYKLHSSQEHTSLVKSSRRSH